MPGIRVYIGALPVVQVQHTLYGVMNTIHIRIIYDVSILVLFQHCCLTADPVAVATGHGTGYESVKILLVPLPAPIEIRIHILGQIVLEIDGPLPVLHRFIRISDLPFQHHVLIVQRHIHVPEQGQGNRAGCGKLMSVPPGGHVIIPL